MHSRITKKQVKDFIKTIKLDIKKYKWTIDDLHYGMSVELEHGYVDKTTNVTNDNLLVTGKIALAHLFEIPDYYTRLKKLEADAEKYWKSRSKTNY